MKSRKFNIVDVLIITVILLVIIAGIFRAFNLDTLPHTVKDQNIIYTLKTTPIDAVFKSSLISGEQLFLNSDGSTCGKIVSATASYNKKDVALPDGTIDSHIDTTEIVYTISVETTADITQNGFYTSTSNFICLGNTLDFYTQTFSFTADVVDFSSNNN